MKKTAKVLEFRRVVCDMLDSNPDLTLLQLAEQFKISRFSAYRSLNEAVGGNRAVYERYLEKPGPEHYQRKNALIIKGKSKEKENTDVENGNETVNTVATTNAQDTTMAEVGIVQRKFQELNGESDEIFKLTEMLLNANE